MKIRTLIATVALMALGTGSLLAQLSQYKEWDEGPVQFLMTGEEKRDWRNVKTDSAAEEFIALFWARRDPTPGTEKNEFREIFDQRVAFADERYTVGRIKGSLSDRGKTVILFGVPTRVARTGRSSGPALIGSEDSNASDTIPTETWIWEPRAEDFKLAEECEAGTADVMECRSLALSKTIAPFLGQREMQIVFMDQNRTNDWRLSRSPRTDVKKATSQVQEYYLFQPDLEAVPSYGASPAAAATTTTVSIPASEIQVSTSFRTPALESAWKEFRALEKSPYENVYVSYSHFITPEGEYYVPVQLYMPPNDVVVADRSMSFFGVIENAAGDIVAVYEEPVQVASSRNDVYVDRSLMIQPGEYIGTFGLAVDGKPVTIARTDLKLEPITADASRVSPLILSNNIFPLTEAQAPTDPFAFGGVKVVPKGDRTFQKSDELWYFFELMNPGLDEAGNPKVQVGVNLVGKLADGKTKKYALPLSDAQPQALKGVPGHYAIGNAIALETFAPGEYTIDVKIIDTVAKKTYNLKESFRVVP